MFDHKAQEKIVTDERFVKSYDQTPNLRLKYKVKQGDKP
jgi:hypothetical protein